MCRNIRTLYNFEPPATETEIRAACLQFVRKVSGYNKPSHVNRAAFDDAVDRIAAVTAELLDGLTTQAPAKDRDQEARKTRARAARRYGQSPAGA